MSDNLSGEGQPRTDQYPLQLIISKKIIGERTVAICHLLETELPAVDVPEPSVVPGMEIRTQGYNTNILENILRETGYPTVGLVRE